MPTNPAEDLVVEDESLENEGSTYSDAEDPVDLDLMLASGQADHLLEDEDTCTPRNVTPFDEVDVGDIEDLLGDGPTQATPARRGRPRGASVAAKVNPNADFTKETSVYQRLIDYGLLKKITDIVLAKVQIPWHLRDDATQEVHAYWAGLVALPQYQKNQLGNYAYRSGQHAALKLRRTIGAVVTIPGAAFRTGRDSAFMESIGAAVNPKDVDDYKDSIELSLDPELPAESWINERFFIERTEGLCLSAKQRQVAYKALVERQSTEDISKLMSMPIMYVERLLNQVTAKIEARDAAVRKGVVPTPEAKKTRKHKGGPGPSAKPYKASKRSAKATPDAQAGEE